MTKRLPLTLLAVAALLGGCAQKPITPDIDPLVRMQFRQTFHTALQRSISSQVKDTAVGAVVLEIVANRQGQAVSCKAKGNPEGVARLPPDMQRTNARQFAAMIEGYCRQAILPSAPDALYDDKGQIHLRGPIVMTLSARGSRPWKVHNARKAFFHEHLLGNEQVDSVGLLVVRYQVDGKGCLVDLRPHDMRPLDFKLDGALLSRLNQACTALDLSGLPGMATSDPQQSVGQVWLEYAPWTVGR